MTISNMVSIKLNAAEHELLSKAYAVSGDKGVSTHIKRVYFDALRLNTDVLEGVRRELESLHEGVRGLQTVERSSEDPAMVLSLLCGLYLMVRKSVPDAIRSQSDKYLEVDAIENYLKGTI